MRTFVMGDIHGNHMALLQCLQRSGFDKNNDRLIQLGDIVDGQLKSFESVEELLTIRNLVAICGNHDDWFREFINTGYHITEWGLGAKATARSYLAKTGRPQLIRKSGRGYKHALDPGDIPERHKAFFNSLLPYYIDEENNCFVHGGFDRHNSFHNQRHELYYWDRELWTDALAHFAGDASDADLDSFYIKSSFKNIFIGHTSTLHWDRDQPMKAGPVYNIDTGAGELEGKLTIMNVSTKEWFQSDNSYPVHDHERRDKKNFLL